MPHRWQALRKHFFNQCQPLHHWPGLGGLEPKDFSETCMPKHGTKRLETLGHYLWGQMALLPLCQAQEKGRAWFTILPTETWAPCLMTLVWVVLSTPPRASGMQLSASLALEWVQIIVSRKSHSSVLVSQVTLNNVEVCSENISTLKKTLEVQGKLPISFQWL